LVILNQPLAEVIAVCDVNCFSDFHIFLSVSASPKGEAISVSVGDCFANLVSIHRCASLDQRSLAMTCL
jgi:hypothetical protein